MITHVYGARSGILGIYCKKSKFYLVNLKKMFFTFFEKQIDLKDKNFMVYSN